MPNLRKRDKVKSAKRAAAAPVPPQTEATPGWVLDMYRHYSRTGFYRAKDLDRVLGDPRVGLEGESSVVHQFAAKLCD